MVELMAKTGNLKDKAEYEQAVLKREEESTTGIGEGIAIPHGKSEAVLKAGLAAMVVKEGTEYESMDGQPANLLFMIAVPKEANNTHIEILLSVLPPLRCLS